jgi:alkanesulfonate monooxygenase SsuD/methylene tetrahydromethanopterin reductase-like flavin-dependent oxidoreductase (luciferase family)
VPSTELSQLTISRETLPGSQVALAIEVPADEVDRGFEKVITRLSQKAKIQGFRPGKAPRAVVEARLGPQAIREEAIEALKAVWGPDPVEYHGRYFNIPPSVIGPKPVQKPHPPIMIGGSGEKLTLKMVAKYADEWNAFGTPDEVRHKIEVLRRHCEDVGRNPAEIEFTLGIKATIRDSEADADRVWKAAMEHNRTPLADVADDQTFWNGTAEQLAEKLAPYVELGFHTVISEQPAPYDTETLERLIGEVKPLVDKG